MGSQYRRVEIAPGHSLLANLAPGSPTDGDRVLVSVRGRGRMYVTAARWNAAEVHRG